MDIDVHKRAAAARALEFVRPGMRLGLGTGSTAAHFVDMLGERVRAGLTVVAVPTSEATRAQATRLGIALTTLDEEPELDLTVDGADEIAPDLTLIKGGGGALLREKIVASASAQMIVIADHTKWVPALGRFPLPIEIVPFGATATSPGRRERSPPRSDVQVLPNCAKPKTAMLSSRMAGTGSWTLNWGASSTRELLAARLCAVPGVMEHGLFIGLASAAIVAGPDGVRLIERP